MIPTSYPNEKKPFVCIERVMNIHNKGNEFCYDWHKPFCMPYESFILLLYMRWGRIQIALLIKISAQIWLNSKILHCLILFQAVFRSPIFIVQFIVATKNLLKSPLSHKFRDIKNRWHIQRNSFITCICDSHKCALGA